MKKSLLLDLIKAKSAITSPDPKVIFDDGVTPEEGAVFKLGNGVHFHLNRSSFVAHFLSRFVFFERPSCIEPAQ